MPERLLADRIITLSKAVDDEVADALCSQLLYLEAQDPNAPIWFYINSPGGSVTAGFAIYDTMQFVACDVATMCFGMAASMGHFLLCAGTPGKRFAFPNSSLMMHQPSAGLQGTAADIHIQIENTLRLRRRMSELYAEHTRQPEDRIVVDWDRDHWYEPAEALEYGMIDRVIEHRRDIQVA